MIRYGIKSIMSKMDWTQIKNVIKSSKEHSIFIVCIMGLKPSP